MKKSVIRTAGYLLLSVLFATGLNAQQYRRGPGHMDRGTRRDAARQSAVDKLALTDEQQSTLKTLREEHFETIQPLREKMVELKASERTLLSAEEVDMKALNEVIDEQTGLLNTMKKLQVEHRIEAKSVLTDEQLLKLENRKDQREQYRPKGNEQWGSPRRGRPYHRSWG